MRVAFVDGKVMMWPKGKTIDDATMIGEEDRGLYKLKGHPEQSLVDELIEPSELLHRRLAYRTTNHYQWQAKQSLDF